MCQRHVLLLWMACLVCSTACKGKSGTRASDTDSERAAPEVTAAPEPAAEAAPAEVALAEDDVRAVVETWRKAQTDGDFERYAALYGAGFTGIKRAGDTTKTFDRDGWLADRKSMFARPMQVEVADIQVTIAGNRATVELWQTWISGRFGDTGRKRLVVEKNAGALQLHSEEMLDSTLLLTGDACLRALFAKHDPARRRVETDDGNADVDSVEVVAVDGAEPGKRFICMARVLFPDRKAGRFYVALVDRRGKRWRAVDSATYEFDYDYPLQDIDDPDEQERLAVESETRDATAKIRFVAISPEEKALVVEVRKSIQGWEYGVSSTNTYYHRLRRDSLHELMTLHSKREPGSADFDEIIHTEEIEFLSTTTRGFYDARLISKDATENELEDTHDERKSVTRLVWSGTDYVER